ncbi:MAG: sulfurtransferase TusA family protein [Actinomycetota bacterium]
MSDLPSSIVDFGTRGCGDGIASEFKERIADLEPGQTIEVVVRDPSARTDLPAICRMLGHEILSTQDTGDSARILVRRSD